MNYKVTQVRIFEQVQNVIDSSPNFYVLDNGMTVPKTLCEIVQIEGVKQNA